MDLITALRMVLETNMASHYLVGDEMVLVSQTRIQKPLWTWSKHKKWYQGSWPLIIRLRGYSLVKTKYGPDQGLKQYI